MDEELNNEKFEIKYEYLKKNELTFDSNKKYLYLKLDNLKREEKIKIITILEENIFMPYNYLKFIYETYIEYIKEIINDGVVPKEILEECKSNKFGLIIKVDEKTKKINN